MMTKEAILKRKQELEQMRDQALANANALQGATQECDYWLGVLESPDAPAEPQAAGADDTSVSQTE